LVRRTLVVLLVLVTAVTLALAGWLWSVLVTVVPRTQPGDLVALASHATPTTGSIAWKTQHGARITLLLLAKGGSEGEDANLTDTILLLSVGGAGRPVIISLPRWLSVSIPAPARGEISGQLYAAYKIGSQRGDPHLSSRWQTATGGGDLAAATVSQLTGRPTDAWVLIDIDAFPPLIDALGGIWVTVPAPLDDPHYPVDDSGGTIHVRFDAGLQWMNGERALEYARSRLSTSDTDRSSRQEVVLIAILHRLTSLQLSPGTLRIPGLLSSGVRTNLLPPDMREMFGLVSQLQLKEVRRVTIDDSNFLRKEEIPSGYILLPRDGTYAALRSYLAEELSG